MDCIQSSQPWDLVKTNFVYKRKATNRVLKVQHMHIMRIQYVRRDSGLTKLGMTPGGGFNPGVCPGIAPGVSPTIVWEAFGELPLESRYIPMVQLGSRLSIWSHRDRIKFANMSQDIEWSRRNGIKFYMDRRQIRITDRLFGQIVCKG